MIFSKKFCSAATSSRLLFFLGLTAILGIGAWLRMQDICTRGLEYDEIWTLNNYAKKSAYTIFTEVSTPNNHVFHSLMVKLTTSTLGDSFIAIRLPALIAGLLIILLVPPLTMLLWRDRLTTLLATAFCSFNAALIYYSQTARGYSIQTLMILLVAYGIILLEKRREFLSQKLRFILAAGIFICAEISVLTLPTSILFLIPLGAAHSIYLFRQIWMSGNRKLLVSVRSYPEVLTLYFLFTISCGTWYGFNWQQFSEGKVQFGTQLASLADWGIFAFSTLDKLSVTCLLLASLGLLLHRKERKYFFATLGIIGFPLISALITSSGPARAYLPIVPFIVMTASRGIIDMADLLGMQLRGRVSLMALISLAALAYAPISLKSWPPVDWKKNYTLIRQAFPLNAYICFLAGDGFSIRYNNMPSALDDTFCSTPQEEDLLFIQVGSSKFISGFNPRNCGEKQIKSNATPHIEDINGISCAIYRLVRLKQGEMPAPGTTVILSIPPEKRLISKDISLSILKHSPDNWIILNTFIEGIFNQDGNEILARVLATDDFPLSKEEVTRIGTFKDCKIFLYTLENF